MAGNSLCSMICFLFLAVLSSVAFSIAGGARYVECDPPNCYGVAVDKDVDDFLRPSRASGNMLSYLTRPRGLRSLDVIDAPSFGGSRTFGGFGYNSRYNADLKRSGAQMAY